MNEAQFSPIGWVKFWNPKDDWYYLTAEARQAYLQGLARVTARALEKGARQLGRYKCRGQSSWARFEVWEFPRLQVLIDFSNELEEIGHFQYFSEDHTVGYRYETPGQADTWVI